MLARAYVLLLLTTLFWGGNSVAGKMAVGHISPMLLTAARWGFACAALLAIGWPHIKKDWPLLKKHWLLLCVLGGAGFTIFNVVLYTALVYTTAINASIEQAAIPMLIFLLNFLFFRTKAGFGQIAGLILTIFGVLLTASHGEPARLLLLDLNFGDAIMIIAIIVYPVYTIILRYKPAIHWQSLMFALTGFAFLTSLPFVTVEYAMDGLIVLDTRGWAILLYTVLFPSLVSQILYIKGVEYIGANRAGLFINLVPVFGTILSIIILGEEFHIYHAVALVLVFGGIALAEVSGRRREAAS